jgi:hypothetical protein
MYAPPSRGWKGVEMEYGWGSRCPSCGGQLTSGGCSNTGCWSRSVHGIPPVLVCGVDSRDAEISRLTSALAASEAALATERERAEAYKKAKEENDERFMLERDAAVARAEKAEVDAETWMIRAASVIEIVQTLRPETTCGEIQKWAGVYRTDLDAALASLAAAEAERDRLRARVANHALAMECTPSAALSKIADALKEPMHCGHGLDCLNDTVKGEEYCVWCALIDETGEVERLKRTLRAAHEMLNKLKAQPYDARVFNAEILCLRINSAIAATYSRAVEEFAEWLADQCPDQSVWVKDDETEDDTHTTFRAEYPPSVTTRTLSEAAARFLASRKEHGNE